MSRTDWFSILVALLLVLTSSGMIVYVSRLDQATLLSSSVVITLALFGLSVTTFAALTLILREIASRLRQQSIEQAREQALAEHRRFLRRLDHELKNPITALRAGLATLSLSMQAPHDKTVSTLEAEVLRLSRLVEDLRKLAELEVSSLEVHPIDIASFIEEMVSLDEERIQSHNRHFVVENDLPSETGDVLHGDQNLLLLAVHNLLDNALKYTERGDTITLRVYREDIDLVIRVSDTGHGIEESDLPLVWEELYRGRGSQGISGYGIGLALVKAIVERHAGQVSIESQIGTGTTITIHLPFL
jgi:two-component system, OmpR family, sensor kinase